MMQRLLRKIAGKKRPAAQTHPTAPDTASLLQAKPGDIVTLHLPEDAPDQDPHMLVQKALRCTGGGSSWVEILAEDATRRLWLEYSERNGEPFLVISHAHDGPVAPESLGILVSDLDVLDEEQSTNNGLIIEGRRFSYLNSYECRRVDDNGEAQMSWAWDLLADDGRSAVSISKRKEAPYEVYTGDVVNPDAAQLRPA